MPLVEKLFHKVLRTVVLQLFVLVFSAQANEVLACSCFGKGMISVEDYNSYDLIFEGRLLNLRPPIRDTTGDLDGYLSNRIACYIVTRTYKGRFHADTVIISDAEDLGACGLGKLAIGSNYLIYARKYMHGFYTTDCFRTTKVPNHVLPRDSIVVNQLVNLKSFGRIFEPTRTNYHADTFYLVRHLLKAQKRELQRFYDENGQISADGKYVNGVQEGFWKYYDNGKVVSKGNYLNGQKDSLWVESFMDKSVYVREYKNGEFTYRETMYWEGRVSRHTAPAKGGKSWVQIDYHQNGQPRYIASVTPPTRDSKLRFREPRFYGLFKMFNKRGVVLECGKFDAEGMVGHWKYFYEDGMLRLKGNYANRKKIGVWKIYYPNKRVKAFGRYQDDEKLDDWKFFDERGVSIPPDPELIKVDEDWFTYSGVKN